MANLVSFIYLKLILKVQLVGKEKLTASQNQGQFIYANHTQAFGDVVMPLAVIPASDYYAIASQANWGIPILGKLVLPYFGLPVGHNLKEASKLISAITTLIAKQKTIVIYPEAHVWPYYTQIRPFSATSMHFPIKLNTPSYAMTTTYQQPKSGKQGKHPQIIVYLDGPFYPDPNLDNKHAQQKLHDQIVAAMQERAKLSNYDYCTYQKTN
ncbi:1-acyl-sn-glycerol-3-phosphate acyltransferase [Lactobacillus sp. ESL0680]|uniref:lysophospholipid acyltransferase family protein n=1 Tax=Lactobacillus sp. ESL0680 TaxID=2983210 RepID=UPI0023F82319|nr:1-acyl-sn-glycerol-3-phosphate acyltransferase [Lactobacillus sp. ESL0680]WEV38741.1 1-acyl-sn-glycerol-3-phosphate acyltransferase [Lactobacillus sp. ESL0680]